jgi:hypothetical protein
VSFEVGFVRPIPTFCVVASYTKLVAPAETLLSLKITCLSIPATGPINP